MFVLLRHAAHSHPATGTPKKADHGSCGKALRVLNRFLRNTHRC